MRVTRRQLLKQIGAAGAALALPASAEATDCAVKEPSEERESSQQRPNIVFIMADQLAAASLGCYGSGVASTPTIDGLASRGVRFDRSYAHSPVCAPNRSSIFTGRCVDVHGVIVNNYHLTTDNPLVTQVLKSNGYRTGGFGKFHFTSMFLPPPEDHVYYGFDESIQTEDPRWGPWLDWTEKEHRAYYEKALSTCWAMPYRTSYGKDKRDMNASWREAVQKYLQPLKKSSDWHLMYTSPLPAELVQTTYITDVGLDFIGRHRRNHPDKPFFCFLSYVDPHDPYDPPEPYDTMFAARDMPAPIPRAVDVYGPKVLEGSQNWFSFKSIADKPEITRKLRALYHGSIKLIDDQIARVTRYLEDNGLMDNTIVVFTTDHGDMMGDHGFIAKGPMHYDKCARTPLIVCGRGIKGKQATDRLTTSLDLFPSLSQLIGLDLLPPLDGKSFASVCRGEAETDKWPEVTVQFAMSTSIVTDDGWRLSLFDEQGQGQMFDLKEDPNETRDLYSEPEWASKKTELMDRYTRAYNSYRRKERYRNLPVIDGKRHEVDKNQIPTTPLPW